MSIGWCFAGQRPGSVAIDVGIDKRWLRPGDVNGNGANVTSKLDRVEGHKTLCIESRKKTYVWTQD